MCERCGFSCICGVVFCACTVLRGDKTGGQIRASRRFSHSPLPSLESKGERESGGGGGDGGERGGREGGIP